MNRTSIEWTDYSWNPVTGCTKVSAGCRECYAETMTRRFSKLWGYSFSQVRIHEDRLGEPWLRKKPSRIFVCDMSDLFHENVPFKFIDLVFTQIARCRWHTFQILTKRPERMREYFDSRDLTWKDPGMQTLSERLRYYAYQWDFYFNDPANWKWPLPNLWIGTSCEDQKTADARIPDLVACPAAVLFVSCEPLLGRIDFEQIPTTRIEKFVDGKSLGLKKIHHLQWVIAGGESGHNARPMHPDWLRSIRDQCNDAHIPFFFKQWGEYLPLEFDAQPPYRFFSHDPSKLIDGHAIDVLDAETGEAGTFQGLRFLDPMESIVYCNSTGDSQCDFLRKRTKKFSAKLDGQTHKEFPTTNQIQNVFR